MAITKQFDIEVLNDILDGCAPPEGYTLISDTLVDTSRWSVIYEMIFTEPNQEKDTAWLITYSVPATEQQEGQGDGFDSEATLVKKRQKVIDIWEPV